RLPCRRRASAPAGAPCARTAARRICWRTARHPSSAHRGRSRPFGRGPAYPVHPSILVIDAGAQPVATKMLSTFRSRLAGLERRKVSPRPAAAGAVPGAAVLAAGGAAFAQDNEGPGPTAAPPPAAVVDEDNRLDPEKGIPRSPPRDQRTGRPFLTGRIGWLA